jgi:ketosteroid isomerase-like protein
MAQTPGNDAVDDQADVWAQVEQQWAAEEKGDNKWMDRMLTDDFSGWGKESPAPRSKASTKMWNRFNEQISEMVAHELYPLSIVVHDDVAIAHYMYRSATKDSDKDGKIETINGRYTDILVRTDDGWKFIAWAGGGDD